jgi:cytochrome c-type biogenesis protein CcmF
VLVVFGVHPWESLGDFYALVTIVLSALVAFTIFAEFYRGGRVISRHTGMGLVPAMVQLTRRNTRRYGGYIVHFGIVLVMVGFAGTAFNKEVEQEMGFGDTMTVGAYTLTAKSFTQDDNSNFASEWAIVDVTKGGKFVTTLYPERRVYKASQQPATVVANRSTLAEDLYLVYEGRNPQTDKPILKVHLNPLVNWIWIGALILLAGTVLTLVPNVQSVKMAAAAPAAVPAGAGD